MRNNGRILDGTRHVLGGQDFEAVFKLSKLTSDEEMRKWVGAHVSSSPQHHSTAGHAVQPVDELGGEIVGKFNFKCYNETAARLFTHFKDFLRDAIKDELEHCEEKFSKLDRFSCEKVYIRIRYNYSKSGTDLAVKFRI